MQENNRPHGLILQQRADLSLSGVNKVCSYDDNTVKLLTTEGKLLIRGEHLSLGSLDTNTGELLLTGRIRLIEYQGGKTDPGGLKEKLFG